MNTEITRVQQQYATIILQALEAPHGNDAQFFHSIVACAVASDIITGMDFCDRFGIRFSTLMRWILGKKVPHLSMRPVVYTFIRSRCADVVACAVPPVTTA